MKKIKFSFKKWIVFEENEKMSVTHFCSGIAGKTTYKERKPWFHNAIDVEKISKCPACETEVPENVQMIIKLNNYPG